MSKVVLSASGGMDSAYMLHLAASKFKEVHVITFDYGQRHVIELEYLDKQLELLRDKYKESRIFNQTLDVKYIKEISPTSSLTNREISNPDIKKMAGEAQPSSYVPFRNTQFLSICAAKAESIDANEIWYGATKVDSLAGYYDASKEFISVFNQLLSLNRKNKITLEAPLIEMDKTDIVREGIKIGVDFSKTYTCYSGELIADLSTPSSSMRAQGFIANKIKDPQKYIQQDLLDKLYEANGCVSIYPDSAAE